LAARSAGGYRSGCIFGKTARDRNALGVALLREWPEAERKSYAAWWLGEDHRLQDALNDLESARQALDAAEDCVTKLTRERDEAREQRNAHKRRFGNLVAIWDRDGGHRQAAEAGPEATYERVAQEIANRHDDLAAANARAEEEERNAARADEQSAAMIASLDTERAARVAAEAERDGTLTEANDLRLRVERLVEGAAKLTERAEEAEEEWRLADFRVKSAESRSDDFAARLAAAEAEVKRLRLAWDDPEMDATDGAHPAWWRGNDAGVAGAVRIVNEALDEALPLAGCVGGADLERVRQRIAALRERAERLVRAGDDMAALLPAYSELLARWAAAKGTK
jgi:chromosome segregation ATPase